MGAPPRFGETWVYESIVGAVPGVDLTGRQAAVLQFGLFEAAIVGLAAVYDLWDAALAGTAAVGVAAAGSAVMLHLGGIIRRVDAPEAYRRHLFGSSVEVVLGVLAFVGLVTHLFVVDPTRSASPLVRSLFGADPPVAAVYLALLVFWDLCYRIGTSWWAAVLALWRSVRYRFDPRTAAALRRADAATVGFAMAQTLLLPFLRGRPILLVAVGGHVLAVTVVAGAAYALVRE
ncbi:MAG: hypothetical protein ABEJ34_00105 [Haloferacaceae archaeon]